VPCFAGIHNRCYRHLRRFDACLAIKSNAETRLIPVLLLTSLNGDDDRIRGIMCGADDFLSKPVNKHELLARVYSLLRLKKFTDELVNAEAVLFSLALSIEARERSVSSHKWMTFDVRNLRQDFPRWSCGPSSRGSLVAIRFRYCVLLLQGPAQ